MKAPHLIDSSAIIDRAIKTPYHPKLLTLQNRGSLLSSLMNGLSYFCISYFSLQGLQCQERNLFLFNDLLLIAKERSSSHFKLKDQVRCYMQDNVTVTIARKNRTCSLQYLPSGRPICRANEASFISTRTMIQQPRPPNRATAPKLH